jgi:general secretion pathway protein G
MKNIRCSSLIHSNRLSRATRREGYTLIEIMLVLSIIAILLSAGIYYMVGNVDIARETRVRGDIQTLTTQLRAYEMQNLYMPTTEQGLQALVTMPTTDPKPRRWSQLMQKDGLIDPWGQPYQYMNPGKHNPTGFDLWSMGADRQDGTADDIGNWEDSTTTGN